jgi:16S rRNA (guanine966-N2)-methyltransferase
VREALFSLVGHDLTDVRVLDAFGGSGLIALEAWSRGAQVTVVEQDRGALAALRANVHAFGAEIDLLAGDVHHLSVSLGTFDGVYADPPYAADLSAVIATLAPLARSWLVLESAAEVAAPAPRDGLTVDRRRAYGIAALTVYRREA